MLPLPLFLACLSISTFTVADKFKCANHEGIKIHGIGASFSTEIFDNMGQRYVNNRTHFNRVVEMNYKPLDSENANNAILRKDQDEEWKGQKYMYASSTLPLTVDQKIAHPHVGIYPVFAAPMVVIYNLPGVANLTISVKSLPKIYMGLIKNWNHEEIRQANPTVRLPNAPIMPVGRYDASEDTSVFTETLSAFSADFGSNVGIIDRPGFEGGICCNSTTWPRDTVKYFGRGHIGMVGTVSSIKYTIGYVSMGTSKTFRRVTYASLYNSFGYKVDPTTQSVQNAMDYWRRMRPMQPPEYSIVNALQADAYPIATFKYVIFNVSTSPDVSCCQMEELVGFLVWVLDQPDDYFKGHGRAAIIPGLAENIRRSLKQRVFCKDENIYTNVVGSFKGRDMKAFIRLSGSIGALCILASIGGAIAYLCVAKRKKQATLEQFMIDMLKLKQKGDSSTSSLTIRGFDGLRAIYDQQVVLLLEVNLGNPMTWDRRTRKETLRLLANVNQASVMKMLGFAYERGDTYLVAEAATKGTLHSAFNESKVELDLNVRILVCLQIADGISYLHNKEMVHGLLSCQTVFLDASWAVKITRWMDYQIYSKCIPEEVNRMYALRLEELKDDEIARFWYADPRSKQGNVDKETDMFAIGMILFEIIGGVSESRGDVGREMMTLLALKFNEQKMEFPKADRHVPKDIEFLIHMCTNMTPESRPSISFVIETLKKMRLTHRGIVDILMESLESYRVNLEKTIDERKAELETKTTEATKVGNKMEELLHEVLPPAIATKLLRSETVEPEYFESVTIYFSDIVGFTEICSASNPMQIIGFLNDLWRLFDTIIEKYDVYKVDVISGNYMVCSGLPHRNGDEHARQICLLAIDIFTSCPSFRFVHLPQARLKIRIGINTGPVTSGVVGSKMPQYCVFGDAVNVASRMQSTAETMMIQVSQLTHDVLESNFSGEFDLTYRGEVECKGKGALKTYSMMSNKDKLNKKDHRVTRKQSRDKFTSIMPIEHHQRPNGVPPPPYPLPPSIPVITTDLSGTNKLKMQNLPPIESMDNSVANTPPNETVTINSSTTNLTTMFFESIIDNQEEDNHVEIEQDSLDAGGNG